MLKHLITKIKNNPLETLLGVVVGLIISMALMTVLKFPIFIIIAALAVGLACAIYSNLKDLAKQGSEDEGNR